MRKNMKKRGALELSVNSIVIMVIAFVVLGLILTFTRMIFKTAEEKTVGAFAITDLETKPTAENPITFPRTVNIKKDGKETMKIGFYNRGSDTAEAAVFNISSCVGEDGEGITENAPSIVSLPQTVGPSESVAYNIVLKDNGGLAGGANYICIINLVKQGDASKIYETQQLFLKVLK